MSYQYSKQFCRATNSFYYEVRNNGWKVAEVQKNENGKWIARNAKGEYNTRADAAIAASLQNDKDRETAIRYVPGA